MDVHQRIRQGREALGLSVEAFAEKVGVSRGAVQQWENGGTAPKRANQAAVADALKITVAELMSDGIEVIPGPKLRGVVPLISWVQAGDWNDANDQLQPGEAERWLPCPVNHSARTYALRVRGDSMTAPYGTGRTYPEGCIIFVDPDKRSPANGTRVIARLDGSDDVTFKVFKDEDGQKWLQPLNPQHQSIRGKFRILGTIIGKWEDE